MENDSMHYNASYVVALKATTTSLTV